MVLAALAGVAALTLAACGGLEGTAPPQTVRVERATVSSGVEMEPIPHYQITPGETAFRAIERLARLAAHLPSQTRRSEESQALQQFSTPIELGFVACIAAGITPSDLVLEPSAGTGLLAIFAELAGASLVLNELAETRAGLKTMQALVDTLGRRTDQVRSTDLCDAC